MKKQVKQLKCSFCNKKQDAVKVLITNKSSKNKPTPCICEGCVAVCVNIIVDKMSKLEVQSGKG